MLTPERAQYLTKLARKTDIEYGIERIVRGNLRDSARPPIPYGIKGTTLSPSRIVLSSDAKVVSYLRDALADIGLDATTGEVRDYLKKRRISPPREIPDRSPQETLAAIEELFEDVSFFDAASNPTTVPIVWLNCELLDAAKGTTLHQVFSNIMARSALTAMAEANADGVARAVNDSCYDFFAATPNWRGQGCVIAWHKDVWEPVRKYEHGETAAIDGVVGLRMTAEVVLLHKFTGLPVRFLASHFKSLRGGWEKTADVRFAQTANLLSAINQEPVLPTIAPGDYNCYLYRLRAAADKDLSPFLREGWSLLGGFDDRQPTHLFGGRLDGIFYKWLSSGMCIDDYKRIPIYAAALEVTDHAAVMGTLHFS
jgi:hypothetical protein